MTPNNYEMSNVSSGGGTFIGYSVEARCNLVHPKQINWMLLGDKWQHVEFPESQSGVPRSHPSDNMMRQVGLHSYAAAQALRWWFVAEAAANFGDIGLDTRLVRHECKYNYSVERMDEVCLIESEKRETMMPDWGKAAR